LPGRMIVEVTDDTSVGRITIVLSAGA
jgi:hypothetical protein